MSKKILILSILTAFLFLGAGETTSLQQVKNESLFAGCPCKNKTKKDEEKERNERKTLNHIV